MKQTKSVEDWFSKRGFAPAGFQRELWQQFGDGNNGLLVAPTGAGKTYAVAGAVVAEALRAAAAGNGNTDKTTGLRLLWVTPLRALAADIAAAVQELCSGVGLEWEVALRTGDTSSSLKAKQRKRLPEVLITTPESLHMMLSYPGGDKLFANLICVVADEWHDLLGTKRGVMMQLALAHLESLAPDYRVWGMSATISNSDEALEVLTACSDRPAVLVRDDRPKALELITVIPDNIERFPWAGHLGDRLLPRVVELIQANRSTLVFTNTRNQSEVWYRKLLAADPDLAGQIALHHGSLAPGERSWVEAALHDGRLKAVVCTSSLDLGVDFRPVDTVVQIGSPKGVARFVQRAGRSGHSPGEVSRAYFVPTNALELFEAAALKAAVKGGLTEAIVSPRLSLDVLTQWLVTLGAGDGLDVPAVRAEVRRTYAYRDLPDELWNWALAFVTTGGDALKGYEHFRRLGPDGDGRIRTRSRDITTRHRLNIGAITSSVALRVQVQRGRVLGSVEETFAGALTPGQTFWFAGRSLEFVRVREMTVWVRLSSLRTGITPAWAGGRLPLSSQLAAGLRHQLAQAAAGQTDSPELCALAPIVRLQQAWSHLPAEDELLVEQFHNREGYHTLLYPFEGRAMHEVMAALLASRLGREPNTFSFSYNDYGFELLSALPVELNDVTVRRLLAPDDVEADVLLAVESGSMPRRQFRSIAAIAGLISKGRPGKPQSNRHLQASSEMVYDTLATYDPGNQLLEQARREVLEQVVDISRLQAALERLAGGTVCLRQPPHATPLSFPLMVDRLRERLSTEKLTDRINRMQAQLEHYAHKL